MQPSRMPTYSVQNDGVGPYAIFSCEVCGRDYRSAPALAKTVQQAVTRSALGGLLRNIPVVGNAAANQLDDQQYRTSMSKEELAEAWSQVAASFQECTVCHQVVCASDFDGQSDTCIEHSPRSTELAAHEAAQAGAQAAAAMKGFADVFGLGGAVQRGLAKAQEAGAAADAAQSGTGAAQAGTGAAQAGTGAAQAGPGAAPVACASCGAALPAGARFCAGCGSPVPQARRCASCSAELAPGARFCSGCGTPA